MEIGNNAFGQADVCLIESMLNMKVIWFADNPKLDSLEFGKNSFSRVNKVSIRSMMYCWIEWLFRQQPHVFTSEWEKLQQLSNSSHFGYLLILCYDWWIGLCDLHTLMIDEKLLSLIPENQCEGMIAFGEWFHI